MAFDTICLECNIYNTIYIQAKIQKFITSLNKWYNGKDYQTLTKKTPKHTEIQTLEWLVLIGSTLPECHKVRSQIRSLGWGPTLTSGEVLRN